MQDISAVITVKDPRVVAGIVPALIDELVDGSAGVRHLFHSSRTRHELAALEITIDQDCWCCVHCFPLSKHRLQISVHTAGGLEVKRCSCTFVSPRAIAVIQQALTKRHGIPSLCIIARARSSMLEIFTHPLITLALAREPIERITIRCSVIAVRHMLCVVVARLPDHDLDPLSIMELFP